MRTLALDVGTRTIGLAISDPGGLIATALHVIRRKGHKSDSDEIVRQVADRDVGRLVVGLPLELDGREGHRVRLVKQFVVHLEAKLDLPIVMWDERFSSAAAERSMIEVDMSRAERKARIDAVAAQFFLQGWLDAQPPVSSDGGI